MRKKLILFTILALFSATTLLKSDNVLAFSEQRKYIGEEYDADTGLNYLNARYYNPNIGRFISQDPMFWSLPKELLADPQQLNSYSYARNNPIVGSDPSGLLTIGGPGTVIMGSAEKRDKEWSSSQTLKAFGDVFNETPIVFGKDMGWNGGNNKSDRSLAAQKLGDYINNYDFAEGEKLNVYAYSHFGNVVNEAMPMVNHKIDNLVFDRVPIRSDYGQDSSKIGNYIELIAGPYDQVQNHGGGRFSLSGLIGYVFGGVKGFVIGHSMGKGEFGPAGRYSNNADYSINISKYLNSKSPIGAHTSWDNITQFNKEVAPLLVK